MISRMKTKTITHSVGLFTRILLTLLLSVLPASGILAQETTEPAVILEEVLVTAQKREQNMQDIASSIALVTEKALSDMGASGYEGFAQALPSMQFSEDRPGLTQISLRGISPIAGLSSPVSIYIDEMLVTGQTGGQQDIRTFDVARVEVLRGPQGTLYGEGSLGGTIRVVTNKPDTGGYDGAVDATYSNISDGGNGADIKAMLNIPLVTDQLALRVLATYQDHDGWIDQVNTGKKDVNDVQIGSARAALRWIPNERLTMDLVAQYNNVETGAPYQANSDNQNYSIIDEPREDKTKSFNFTLSYDFNFANIVSATNFYDRDTDPSTTDFSSLAPDFGLQEIHFGRPSTEESFTQEVRLVSTSGGRVHWTTGVFYKDYQSTVRNTTSTVPELPAPLFDLLVGQDFQQTAVFGELTYDFSEKLNGLIGVRYSKEDRTSPAFVSGLLFPPGIGDIDFSSEDSWSVVSPKISLMYDATENVNVYGLISNGFRAGGVNPFAPFLNELGQTAVESFDPEKLWNYEFGIKSTLLDGRLMLNATLFYMDWTNLQVSVPSLVFPFFSFVANAGSAHSSGIELNMTTQVSENWSLGLNGAYINAELDEDASYFDPVFGEIPFGSKGDQLPLVPEWKMNAWAMYRAPISNNLDFMARAEYAYRDMVWTTLESLPAPPGVVQGLPVPSTKMVNIRLGVENDHWGVYLFGNNLTNDRLTQVNTNTTNFMSPDSEVLYVVGQPRTWGINVTYRY
jgi:iron complex outermembrane receptor protein